MNGLVAVLDACALVPHRLSTTLLWLAEAGLFQPLWSDLILEEVERNLPTVGVSPRNAGKRVAAMRDAFGAEALVDGFNHLIDDLTCDPKDRHVLAVAVHDAADTIVTFNIKDFPHGSTDPYGIEVLHPDLFLVHLLADRPFDVIRALRAGVATLHRPPEDLRTWLVSLTPTVPTFANLAADLAPTDNVHDPTTLVPPLVAADPDEALAAFGEVGDLTNPAQVAMVWWCALEEDLPLARQLTWSPKAWRGYGWAIEYLSGKSLASKVIPIIDAPNDGLVFMRFVSDVARPSLVVAPYTDSLSFLILVRIDDGTWRVWGLGPRLVTAADVHNR